MLIGEYNHSLDDKNRISLPVRFRKEMGKQLVITPGLDNCLFIFTKSEWERISKILSESNMLQSDKRSFSRFFFGGAIEVQVDNIGRMLIPDFLVGYAQLKDAVTVIGVQNRLEIWNTQIWQDYKKVVEKKADSLAEKLGELKVL